MMAAWTHETIIAFLRENGGSVKSSDFTKHFKAAFPEDADRRAAVRDAFKKSVDSVAFVKSENGVKHVCLRKKFRAAVSRTVRERSRDTEEPERPAAPGSGYGNDSQVRVPHNSESTEADEERSCPRCGCEVDSSSGEMGNLESFRPDNRESRKEPRGKARDVPEIRATEARPLPADEAVRAPPGPAQTAAAELRPSHRQAESEAPAQRSLIEAEQLSVSRCTNSTGTVLTGQPEAAAEGGHAHGSYEDNRTPTCSRQQFTEVTMNRCPQVTADCDSTSVISSTLDEDRASVALDPLEHEWMLCASDAEWSSLHRLLAAEPFLIQRKDFITGFTCLHWAAKHGRPEVVALIVNFAKQHNVPISIDKRSSTGYTPLHLAAMHGHTEVVKLLVGAYNADVEIRDHSGRKACQYLSDSVSVEMRDISGAYECSVSDSADPRDRSRWRISNLKPLRQLISNDCDPVESESPPREKPLRRKSSLNRMKPKLQNLRARMSQIVHSTSFKDREEPEESKKGSCRPRPHSHFLG